MIERSVQARDLSGKDGYRSVDCLDQAHECATETEGTLVARQFRFSCICLVSPHYGGEQHEENTQHRQGRR